ncbi:MAG: tRNA (N(6)-L-threonylcarbamoyladenosine(37)-C(2))-methylthiotransferase MtaB [Deltaproteobacteria bacterium]|nr:tRNA (N(6)-L-threonylcarbamoyladenosine(37)-C(2))-methylthiotransferase MtaB [Deltaproteobacteria bacterium]
MELSFKIITLGCKVNQYESAYLKEALSLFGWRQAFGGKKPDVTVVNTCIVTRKAAHQSRQAIRRAIRENPEGIVAAIGCYAQVFPDELSGIDGISLIAGNTVKGQVPKLLLNIAESGKKSIILKDFEKGMPFEFLKVRRFPGRARAYLKVQDGCESYCAYCIVPFARGPLRSLPINKILSMINTLSEEGYEEIVLTGIHLGKYGIDLGAGQSLLCLLYAIDRESFPVRIRLSSLEPSEILPDIVEMASSCNSLCRHFHISLQSGDDGVLAGMNRKSRSRFFVKLVNDISFRIPLAAIGVDIMAGFPKEDMAAHQNTCSLLKDLPVSYLHVFPFSPRPGTAASRFGGLLDPKIIKARALELRKIGRNKKALFYQRCLKKKFHVLAEGWYLKENGIMKGMTDNYLPVLFPGTETDKNRLIPVMMESAEDNMMIGSKII